MEPSHAALQYVGCMEGHIQILVGRSLVGTMDSITIEAGSYILPYAARTLRVLAGIEQIV